jgi:bis(5'-nucleosyl)-tetraphosphatase (symmetrical)
MATYAIGDVQGCARSLENLLDVVGFDEVRDRIWFAGDLVNRGPHSLDVLRWAFDHDASIVSVLGNHDLHLLGRAHDVAPARRKDTLDEVLAAPDRDRLVEWLRHRPFVHHEGEFLLVHAGLLPSWSTGQGEQLARAGEAALRSEDFADCLQRWSVRADVRWVEDLEDDERTDAAVRVFCNLRCCDGQGQPVWDFAGPPEQAPDGLVPWHNHPSRCTGSVTIVCGHWAAQGLRVRDDLIALDTGCVWGGPLTAVRLEDRAVFSVPLSDPVDPRLLRR